ncbi:hypothetical protein KRP22_007173 [Phytophthora ramorum]|nr:hypothetical protein KRP22_1730 [Phytophthora ramorum]
MVTSAYAALYAYCYWELQDTYLNRYLDAFQIGMPPPYHHTIAMVHAAMSALHAVCILLMLGGSMWQRSLVFTPWASCSDKSDEAKTDRTSSAMMPSFSKIYDVISDRHGLCGVNGNHFHALLICRELVETALQTVQAYRMSILLPRTLLNRFYIVLLVTNCFSSAVVYSVFFKGDEARRRFVCIVLDCILDLMACVGVELIILLSYASDFNTQFRGFEDFLWRNDEWAARAVNEFRMVVVVSWSDLASRAIFSLGLVITTTNMKELLRRLPRKGNRVGLSASAGSTQGILGETLEAIVPTQSKLSTSAAPSSCQHSKQNLQVKNSGNYRSVDLRVGGARLLLRAAHLLFGAWGVVVLGFHIHASVQPTLPQCLMQVRPWAVSRPSCYLVGLDCHTLSISGRSQEVSAKWGEFDSSTVVQLLIRHCPVLEMPDSISEFHGVRGIKVYNSTIVDWGSSAALTNANHPQIVSLYIVRASMTSGLLPAGFQSFHFPQNLYDIEFCVTNLRALPDDLDSKWHFNADIQIEYSQLTMVPPVLLRLEPKYLALTGNAIAEVPPEIFEIPSLVSLGLGDTKLHELPRNVTNLSPAFEIVFIGGTNISFFWPWADASLESHRLGGHSFSVLRRPAENPERHRKQLLRLVA